MKTALLIDEDRVSRASLAQWLSEAGWEVIEAEDGEGGVALALERKPELVFCDLLTPRCNGFQVCRSLRAHGNMLPHTKIVATTSGGYGTDRLNALEAGADEYIIKPILHPDFLNLLRALQQNGHSPETTTQELRRRVESGGVRNPLLAQAIPPGELRVKFWGVRGSIPTPGPATAFYGGNTSCIEVRADGEIIILDAGTGIRPLGVQLRQEFKDQPLNLTLLISHTHWDHIQGFPFFEPAYNPANKLRILGFEGSRTGLLATLSAQMESPFFPVGWQQLPSYVTLEELRDLKFKIGDIGVEAAYLNHPGICVGYRLNTSGGSVAYLPDNEPFQRYKFHTSAPSTPAGSTEFLHYARRMDQKLVDFISGVDILILDAQYDLTEYQTRVGWGHGCVDDVVALALNANAKKLFLFHHDPSHDDEKIKQMVEWGREFVGALGEGLQVEAAREGLEIVLKPA